MIVNEDILHKEIGLDKTIIGFIPAQCPVYVINVKYLSKDNDPFYPIDRVIVHLLNDNPQANISYMAWLLGFEMEIINSRITHHLIEDGFLSHSPVSGNYCITEAGERKYLNNNGERPDVEVTGAIMVDGVTLELLPDMFYDMDNALRYFRSGKTNVPHKPLLGINDPQLLNAVDNIEKKMRKTHFYYGLEDNGHDLQVIGYDERYIEDAMVLIYSDNEGSIHKELYFRYNRVSLPSISGTVPRYYFYVDANGILHQNHGVSSEEAITSVTCKSTPEGLGKLLSMRYGVKDSSIILPNILTSNDVNSHFPVNLRINSSLLSQVKHKRLLLADARKGKINFSALEGGTFFVNVVTDNIIDSYLRFELALEKWKEMHEHIDMSFIDSIDSTLNWRSILCAIDRHEDLEIIDRKRFFKFG